MCRPPRDCAFSLRPGTERVPSAIARLTSEVAELGAGEEARRQRSQLLHRQQRDVIVSARTRHTAQGPGSRVTPGMHVLLQLPAAQPSRAKLLLDRVQTFSVSRGSQLSSGRAAPRLCT